MFTISKVIGELSNDGKPLRRFLQTFVLVPQTPNKYYVRNDIFRYAENHIELEESGTNGEEQVTAQEEQIIEPVSSGYEEPIQEQHQPVEPQAPMPLPIAVAAAVVPAIETETKQPQEPEKEVHLHNGSAVETIAAAGINVAQVQEVKEEPIASMDEIIANEQRQAQNVVVASPPVSPTMAPAAMAASEHESPEAYKPTTSAIASTVAAAEKQLPSSSNEPKTYASMVGRKMQGNNVAMAVNVKVIKKPEATVSVAPAAPVPASVTPIRSGGDSAGPAINTNAVPNVKSETVNNNNLKNSTEVSPTSTKRDVPAQNRFKKGNGIGHNSANINPNQNFVSQTAPVAPAPAPLVGSAGSSMPINKRNDSKDRVRTGESEDNEYIRGQVSKYPDENQLFIGNLSYNVQESDLRQVFERYGKILDVRINRQVNKSISGKIPHSFAFITYDDSKVVQEIVAQKVCLFIFEIII